MIRLLPILLLFAACESPEPVVADDAPEIIEEEPLAGGQVVEYEDVIEVPDPGAVVDAVYEETRTEYADEIVEDEEIVEEEVVEEVIVESELVEVVQEPQDGAQDVEISYEEQLKRAYIFTAGRQYAAQRVLSALLTREADRREAAGEPRNDMVSEEAVEAGVQERIDSVLSTDPNIDFWEAVAGQGYTPETYRLEVASQLRMSQMYFPEDPAEWPVDQLAVRLSGDFGSVWDQFLKKDHDAMLAALEAGEEPPKLNMQTMNRFVLPTLYRSLLSEAEVEYPSDGLAEGISLRVNGADIPTDEMVETIRPLLGGEQMREAETWVDMMLLAEEELRDSGHWLDEAEIARLWEEELALYEGTIIPHDAMVLNFFRFPSMELYKQYFRVRKSFRATLPDPLPQEMLDAHIAERGLFLGSGKVQATCLLVSALDPRSGRFPVEGTPLADAEARAKEIAEILQSGEDFIEVLLEYSDFPADVPGAAQGMMNPAKGRFPLMMRNDLRGFLGESEFTDVIYGYSATDDVFFHGELGAVYGPVQVPVGYIFYRVEARADGAGVDLVANPNQDFLVRDDILGTRLTKFLAGLRE